MSKYKPQEEYQKRIGYLCKTFKLQQEVFVRFKAACEAKGVSMSSVLTGYMTAFSESVEKESETKEKAP